MDLWNRNYANRLNWDNYKSKMQRPKQQKLPVKYKLHNQGISYHKPISTNFNSDNLNKQNFLTHHPVHNKLINPDLNQETAILTDNPQHSNPKSGHLDNITNLKTEIIREKLLNNPILEYSKYYASDTSRLLLDLDDDIEEDHPAPRAFLLQPYARKGTKRTKFGQPPCGGGILGQSRFVATPGENIQQKCIKNNYYKIMIS
jgi:hypothetical protein